MAMTDHYCTAEEFLVGDYDIRIQKIGKKYRSFKRTAVSGQWKTNTGTSILEEIPMTKQFKEWADACGQCFGGLDIVTVDCIHRASDGKYYILEMNGTSSGLAPSRLLEDQADIKDIVMRKIKSLKLDRCK